jgi:multiple sugar transport system permease protein
MKRRLRLWLKARRLRLRDVPLWLFGMVAALLWFAPFLWMVSTSFKPPRDVITPTVEWIPRTVTLDNYAVVFERPILVWAMNSVVVATVATALGVLTGALAGYALARVHFPGRTALFFLLAASIMIPAEISVVPLYIAFLSMGFVNSFPALILPLIPSVLAVFIFRSFFLDFPSEIEDAAAIDGAGRVATFFRVALPLARAPFIASTILLLTANWNVYLWPVLVTFTDDMKTLPLGIAAFSPTAGDFVRLEGFGPAMAAVTVLSVPSLLFFWLLQRYFIEGFSRSGIKG